VSLLVAASRERAASGNPAIRPVDERPQPRMGESPGRRSTMVSRSTTVAASTDRSVVRLRWTRKLRIYLGRTGTAGGV